MAKDRATRSGAPKARSQTRPRTAAQKLAASKRKAEQAAENPKTGKQRREKQRREAQARAEAAAAEKAKRDERIAARKAHRQEFFDSIRTDLLEGFKSFMLPTLLEDDLPDKDVKQQINSIMSDPASRAAAWQLYTGARAAAQGDKPNEDAGAGERNSKYKVMLHAMQYAFCQACTLRVQRSQLHRSTAPFCSRNC